jgi:hypothetical protein
LLNVTVSFRTAAVAVDFFVGAGFAGLVEVGGDCTLLEMARTVMGKPPFSPATSTDSAEDFSEFFGKPLGFPIRQRINSEIHTVACAIDFIVC